MQSSVCFYTTKFVDPTRT